MACYGTNPHTFLKGITGAGKAPKPSNGPLEVSMRRSLFALVLTLFFALPLFAQDQQEQSLGDIARQTRKAKEERDKSAAQPKKVFDDENVPSSGSSNKTDLAALDSPGASPAERLATARRMIARGEGLLDKLEPMNRSTLAQLVLEGQDLDFPGRRAWEEKLFSAKEHYVSHGRELFRETKELLNNMESLTSGGKTSPTDPRVTEISHRALQLMQDANKTDADFQAILLEGQNLAKKAASH
jgi:hypothetical protein